MWDMTGLGGAAESAHRASDRLARLVDRVCIALMVLLVLDVWMGVVVRYLWPLPITFTEEAARYLMIWTALLAVSACISRREHIGVQVLFGVLPLGVRAGLLLALDLLGVAFFLLICFYGVGLVERGGRTYTMIYGLSKAVPFAAVPVAAALAAIQLALVAVRDQARIRAHPEHVFP